MGWTKNDTAKATGDSSKKVSKSAHDFRNDSAGSGSLPERNANKVKDSPLGPSLHETFKKAGKVT